MPRVHRLPPGDRDLVLQRVSEVLAARTDIAFAYAHGSFIDREGFRDVDVAVWTSASPGRWTDVDLSVELSRVAGYPVDVRIVNQAPVSFLFHVLRGRALVVRDERFLADLIERTARTYHDRAPLLRRAVREAFAA
jgi:uncharacterized protein